MQYRALTTTAALLLLGGHALARDPPPSAESTPADELLSQGRALMASGKHAEACEKFGASEKAAPSADALYQLADCLELTGNLEEAHKKFELAAERAARANLWQHEARARSRLATLEPRLFRLIIEVPPKDRVEGLVVQRDGVTIQPQEWGAAVPVKAGDHLLEATAPGKRPWSRTVTVPRSKTPTVVVVPPLTANDAPESGIAGAGGELPLAVHSDRVNWQRPAGLVVGGLGIAGLAIGGFAGLKALSTKNSLDEACGGEAQRCVGGKAAHEDEERSIHTWATVANVGIIAGGLLATGGAILYLTAPKDTLRHGSGFFRPRLAVRRGALSFEGSF